MTRGQKAFDLQAMSNNLKTALILLSIAAVFFLGVIGKRIFLGP